MKECVKSCLTCQQAKACLQQVMPVPTQPWDNISMDFIMDLPYSKGHRILMVVIHYFPKQAHFISAKPLLTTSHVAKLFFQHIFRYHGLPTAIVSDRDLRFTSKFWKELFDLLGTQLSSTAHPQTDGQTERVNQGIEDYIRCYVQVDQRDWVDHVDLMEFCYNAAKHSATGFSPFELVVGKEILTPLALITRHIEDKIEDPDVDRFLTEWNYKMVTARNSLVRTKESMIQTANKHKRHMEFFEGDLVLVSACNWPLLQSLTPKFNHRYYGPYKVLKSYNGVTYKLYLPSSVEVHDTFHVSLLKHFYSNDKWNHGVTNPNTKESEAILKKQVRKENSKFLIKWKGKPISEAEWLSEAEVFRLAPGLLLTYEQ